MELGLVDVVDKNDSVIKTLDRINAKDSDILRVTGVFILNENNKILLQLRSKNSCRYPLYWDCSGGGHVDSKEDYDTCANRELFEEIGIKTELTFLGKHFIELDDGRKHFIAFYKGKFDGKLNLDPNEVSDVAFFSVDQIKDMVQRGEKFHPECLFALQKYFL